MDWLSIGLQGAEMIGNQANSKLQFERQKKLMSIQQQNQMALNEQGQQIQLDTWEKTNYPAQMAMLKAAGLNPSLMYGKGGAGGTTGSQGGGSAAAGNAPQGQPMNIANILQMKQMQANAKLAESQAAKTDEETKLLQEYGSGKYKAEIEAIGAGAGKAEAEKQLAEVNTRIAAIEEANKQSQIEYHLASVKAMTDKLTQENAITAETRQSIVKKAAAEALGATLENELTISKTKLSETERQGIITKIVQEWTRLGLEGRALDQKDKEIAIHKFTQEIEAEYPNAMNVVGSVLKKAYKTLEWLSSMGTGGVSAVPTDKVK